MTQTNTQQELQLFAAATPASLRVTGLFAGIGGIEEGLRRANHRSALLCEINPSAKRVLEDRFPDTPIVEDVRQINRLPACEVVAAGFPCQDLSQAGRTAGITGERSGLVGEVFRLVSDPARTPRWLVLENVPFMLQLERGAAMRFLTTSLGEMGIPLGLSGGRLSSVWSPSAAAARGSCRFANRRSTRGLVPRRDRAMDRRTGPDGRACGFYWTEGVRRLWLGSGRCPDHERWIDGRYPFASSDLARRRSDRHPRHS